MPLEQQETSHPPHHHNDQHHQNIMLNRSIQHPEYLNITLLPNLNSLFHTHLVVHQLIPDECTLRLTQGVDPLDLPKYERHRVESREQPTGQHQGLH